VLSCVGAEQEKALLTGTDLINIAIFVVLFIAFCDINAIMHEWNITHESIRIIFWLYADFCWSLHNPGRNMYCPRFSILSVLYFTKNIYILLSGETKVYA